MYNCLLCSFELGSCGNRLAIFVAQLHVRSTSFSRWNADMPETQRNEINLINYNVSLGLCCKMHGRDKAHECEELRASWLMDYCKFLMSNFQLKMVMKEKWWCAVGRDEDQVQTSGGLNAMLCILIIQSDMAKNSQTNKLFASQTR